MGKIKARECQNVEYKRSWQDKYLEWICGFANAQGAVMYFGVDDDHEVVGLEHVDKLMEDIPNKVAINEAVELVKKYEDVEVVKFVNGILGTFLREEVKE